MTCTYPGVRRVHTTLQKFVSDRTATRLLDMSIDLSDHDSLVAVSLDDAVWWSPDRV